MSTKAYEYILYNFQNDRLFDLDDINPDDYKINDKKDNIFSKMFFYESMVKVIKEGNIYTSYILENNTLKKTNIYKMVSIDDPIFANIRKELEFININKNTDKESFYYKNILIYYSLSFYILYIKFILFWNTLDNQEKKLQYIELLRGDILGEINKGINEITKLIKENGSETQFVYDDIHVPVLYNTMIDYDLTYADKIIDKNENMLDLKYIDISLIALSVFVLFAIVLSSFAQSKETKQITSIIMVVIIIIIVFVVLIYTRNYKENFINGLTKYPLTPMTSDSTEYNGTFIRSKQNTVYTSDEKAFKLYNSIITDENGAEWYNYEYDSSTGLNVKDAFFPDYKGSYSMFDAGTKFVLKQINIYGHKYYPQKTPGLFRIYATNDVSKFNNNVYTGWDIIYDNTSSSEPAIFTSYSINNEVPYQIYAIVVNKLAGNDVNLKIVELEYYGIPVPESLPVDSPINPPADFPVNPPVDSPVNPPLDSPVNPPVDSPVNPPVNPPVDSPADFPVNSPVNPPVDSPVNPQVNPPVDSPVNPPVNPPVDSPTGLFGEKMCPAIYLPVQGSDGNIYNSDCYVPDGITIVKRLYRSSENNSSIPQIPEFKPVYPTTKPPILITPPVPPSNRYPANSVTPVPRPPSNSYPDASFPSPGNYENYPFEEPQVQSRIQKPTPNPNRDPDKKPNKSQNDTNLLNDFKDLLIKLRKLLTLYKNIIVNENERIKSNSNKKVVDNKYTEKKKILESQNEKIADMKKKNSDDLTKIRIILFVLALITLLYLIHTMI